MSVGSIGDGHTDDSDIAVRRLADGNRSLSLPGSVVVGLGWRDVTDLVAILGVT